MKTLQRLLVGSVLAGVSCLSMAADSFPDHTINYVIPFGPGGESDVAARLQEPFFRKYSGQTVAIQYKAGAGGAAGWSQLNKMTPDGYTVMGTNLPHIVLQPMIKDVGYQTKDLTNLYWFQYTPDALIVPKDSPFKTLADFIKAAKADPGSIIVGGSGSNSGNELAKALFDHLAGIKTTYVPFKGTGASNTALLGHQVQAAWGYTTSRMQMGDQVRCLAVGMDRRHPRLPDCPTFRELGFDMVGGVYRGVAVPADTPKDRQAKLAEILDKINHDPEFVKKMVDNGFSLVNIGPDQMPKFMEAMEKRYAESAKYLGIGAK